MTDASDLNVLTRAAEAGRPEAQYQLGAMCLSKGEIGPALEWLGRAADSNLADAQNLLGVIYLNGIGVNCEPRKAADLFRRAAALDLKEAHFNLSGLLYYGNISHHDDEAACNHLLKAAQLGHRPALRVLGYLYGGADDAGLRAISLRCFAAAALLGDPHAEYALGMHYLETEATPGGSFEESVYWLMRAADKNLYCARRRLKPLIENIGADQLQHIHGEHKPRAHKLADSPLDLRPPDLAMPVPPASEKKYRTVSEYPGSLADTLCDYLVNLAAPQLSPSGVVDPGSGKPLTTNLRTSSSMNFPLSMYDMAVGFACRRLASLVSMPATHAEPISVLRYLPGEEYKPHYDHFAVDEHGQPRVDDANGQRLVTVFVYLNAVDAGGESDFPRLNVRARPAKGKAVTFMNCDANGKPEPDTLHAGLPVIRGEKWLATLWFRERPFDWL